MNWDERSLELTDISTQIVAAARVVAERAGAGLSKQMYQQCLALELKQAGLSVRLDAPLDLSPNEASIFADILVAEFVVVELESTTAESRQAGGRFVDHRQASGYPCCVRLRFASGGLYVERFPAQR